MAANKESLFKIGQNVLSNTVNTGRNLLNKVDFANIVPDPTPQQIEADYISKLGNFVQPAISKGQETLQGLGNFAQENLDRVGDFAQQSVQPGVDAQGEPIMVDGVQQQQGFLRPLIDYAKSPEGAQMLADVARLGFAATRKDPIVGGTIAQGLTDELAQRPIQAAQKEKEIAEQLKLTKDEENRLMDLEDKYRKEINSNQIIKDTGAVNSAVGRMTSVWSNYLNNKNNTDKKIREDSKNALDQALVITFNKMMDPGSVVRESEFARTPQGQALVDRFLGYKDKLREGGVGLTDRNREEIINVAKLLQKGQIDEANKVLDKYEKLANRRGLNSENIFTRYAYEPYERTYFDKEPEPIKEPAISQKLLNKGVDYLKGFYNAK